MDSPTVVSVNCNVCGGARLERFKHRQLARCADCGSMERTRLLQMILDEEKLVKPGQAVLHFAPEPGLGRNIRRIVGAKYDAADLRPNIYPSDLGVRKFNLITQVQSLPSKKYDLIIHSHVLE